MSTLAPARAEAGRPFGHSLVAHRERPELEVAIDERTRAPRWRDYADC
jgi:hypothetical protein